MIEAYAKEFAGKQVVEWKKKTGIARPDLFHYRITLDYEEGESGVEWTDLFDAFLEDPNAARLTGLVVGAWGSEMYNEATDTVTAALVAARERLPALKALFVGDITSEECEISWIKQDNMDPLLAAYPDLEHFRVRGGQGLSFGALRHNKLQSLILETGGMDAEIVRSVCAAHLPELTHLELWLGTDGYGGNTTLKDLQPLLSGDLFPKLTYLGLRDSEIADEIAVALASSPLLARIQTLDLSLGTLGDTGAQALLQSHSLATSLKKLDLHHHYISPALVAQLKNLSLEVDVKDVQTGDDRYVAVGE